MRERKWLSIPGSALVLGATWGFCEAAAGMGLRACAAALSGALLTGGALFFIAAGWAVSRRILSVALMMAVAAGFKLFDALLLGLPLRHGAIGNPIFAIFLEGLAFIVFAGLLKQSLVERGWGRAIHGGLAALLAANLFPLVRFATGVPACTVAGTGYPLSLYYLHVAVLVSAAAVPLGYSVGERIRTLVVRPGASIVRGKFSTVLSPALLALFLGLIALIRRG